MTGQIYFGNTVFADWVTAPDSGMQATREGYAEEIITDQGGLYIANSAQTHVSYDMNFGVKDWSNKNSFELYQRFADGDFGTDYVRFIDPMVQDQNLFSPVWANPSLSEQGWKPIYDVTPTYSGTSANSYAKPVRKPTFTFTAASANVLPTGQNSVFTLLIPPTYTLALGASYTATNTGVIQVQGYNASGATGSPVNLTAQTDASAPSFTSTFAGSTYTYVKIYITATSTTANATVTPVALWAQCLPTGTTATISRHIPGKGHAGLRFRGNSRVETYLTTRNHLVGYAATLAEVEPWH